ncbi:MAG TPA: hypothetical protein VKQ08_12400 [Cyclobacteriaceae bacterium]|nr:hypothetical protein [Cyclobacteriaceae bacterium]
MNYTDNPFAEINSQIRKNSILKSSFEVKGNPSFVLIARGGEVFNVNTWHPGDHLPEGILNCVAGNQG